MDKDLVQKFILDPDWHKMEDFIIEFFDMDADINGIDTTLSPENIAIQVKMQQKFNEKTRDLRNQFATLKEVITNKQTTFK